MPEPLTLEGFLAKLSEDFTAKSIFFKQIHDHLCTSSSPRIYLGLYPDHVGWDCGTTKEYEELKQILLGGCVRSHESVINGRRILLVQLREPLKLPTLFSDSYNRFGVIELAEQKPDGSQTSGCDHAEFVFVPQVSQHFKCFHAGPLYERIKQLSNGHVTAAQKRREGFTHEITALSAGDFKIVILNGEGIEKVMSY